MSTADLKEDLIAAAAATLRTPVDLVATFTVLVEELDTSETMSGAADFVAQRVLLESQQDGRMMIVTADAVYQRHPSGQWTDMSTERSKQPSDPSWLLDELAAGRFTSVTKDGSGLLVEIDPQLATQSWSMPIAPEWDVIVRAVIDGEILDRLMVRAQTLDGQSYTMVEFEFKRRADPVQIELPDPRGLMDLGDYLAARA